MNPNVITDIKTTLSNVATTTMAAKESAWDKLKKFSSKYKLHTDDPKFALS